MKNLVTKIALPGAILAFAMALFGEQRMLLCLGKVLEINILIRLVRILRL